MNWLSLFFLVAFLAMPFTVSSAEALELPGWTLVWNDEFDDEEVDTSVWEVLNLRDSHNNEKQFYHEDQAAIVDGVLRLTATDEPLDGKLYRSARLWTHAGWTYGRFEAKAKLPVSQSMWPAIWLLPRNIPWPAGGEIDIMENRGSEPYQVSSAYHWGKDYSAHEYVSHHHKPEATKDSPVNFHDGYHIYAAEWEPSIIRFYVDGVLHFSVTEKEAPIHDKPMSIVLNLAVGGKFGGDPDATTVFPQEFSIDYVRVWQKTVPPLGEGGEVSNE